MIVLDFDDCVWNVFFCGNVDEMWEVFVELDVMYVVFDWYCVYW